MNRALRRLRRPAWYSAFNLFIFIIGPLRPLTLAPLGLLSSIIHGEKRPEQDRHKAPASAPLLPLSLQDEAKPHYRS